MSAAGTIGGGRSGSSPDPARAQAGPDPEVKLVEDAEAMLRHGSAAARYMAAFACQGTSALVANAASRPLLLCRGRHAWPVTVDDGGYGRSYVASPHSAYVLYAREEIDLIGLQRKRAARAGLALLDAALRAARINRAVHIDNWLLSTNLHGGWDGAELPAMRALLTRRFPDHFLIIRSLDPWSSPALHRAARDDGWILLPSRQIWVTDDLARDWRPRNNYANDRRALARSGLTIEDAGQLEPADCAQIAELYRMLYVGRYSGLNPVFTDRFIALSQDTGLLTYRLARDAAGQIVGAAGMAVRGSIMTVPLLGYDTSRPQSDGLYRICSFLFSEWGMERGLALHGSSGAATFKRNRGARGVIEHMAVHAGHLGPGRRAAVHALAQLLERIAVPALQREGW